MHKNEIGNYIERESPRVDAVHGGGVIHENHLTLFAFEQKQRVEQNTRYQIFDSARRFVKHNCGQLEEDFVRLRLLLRLSIQIRVSYGDCNERHEFGKNLYNQ